MTKKQKIKFIALLTTTASLAVGSYFFKKKIEKMKEDGTCLLYTSPSPRDS